MVKGRVISEEIKKKISEMYNEENLSAGSIADKLGISKRTVFNYKDYDQKNSDHPNEEYNETYFDQSTKQENEGIDFVGGRFFKRTEEKENIDKAEEPKYQCAKCGFTGINENDQYCGNCGMEFDW